MRVTITRRSRKWIRTFCVVSYVAQGRFGIHESRLVFRKDGSVMAHDFPLTSIELRRVV